MAEAIIAGLLRRKLVAPEQIVASHPRQARREEMHVKYGIEMFESNREAVTDTYPEATGRQLIDRARREAATFARRAGRVERRAREGAARRVDRRGREDRDDQRATPASRR